MAKDKQLDTQGVDFVLQDIRNNGESSQHYRQVFGKVDQRARDAAMADIHAVQASGITDQQVLQGRFQTTYANSLVQIADELGIPLPDTRDKSHFEEELFIEGPKRGLATLRGLANVAQGDPAEAAAMFQFAGGQAVGEHQLPQPVDFASKIAGKTSQTAVELLPTLGGGLVGAKAGQVAAERTFLQLMQSGASREFAELAAKDTALFFTRTSVAGAAGAQGGIPRYFQAREAGFTPMESLTQAGLSGASTALVTRFFGLTGAEAGLNPVRLAAAKQSWGQVSRNMLKQGVLEMGEEELDLVFQSFLDKATTNPDMTFGEYLEAAGETAIVSAIVGGGVTGVTGVSDIARGKQDEKAKADETAQRAAPPELTPEQQAQQDIIKQAQPAAAAQAQISEQATLPVQELDEVQDDARDLTPEELAQADTSFDFGRPAETATEPEESDARDLTPEELAQADTSFDFGKQATPEPEQAPEAVQETIAQQPEPEKARGLGKRRQTKKQTVKAEPKAKEPAAKPDPKISKSNELIFESEVAPEGSVVEAPPAAKGELPPPPEPLAEGAETQEIQIGPATHGKNIHTASVVFPNENARQRLEVIDLLKRKKKLNPKEQERLQELAKPVVAERITQIEQDIKRLTETGTDSEKKRIPKLKIELQNLRDGALPAPGNIEPPIAVGRIDSGPDSGKFVLLQTSGRQGQGSKNRVAKTRMVGLPADRKIGSKLPRREDVVLFDTLEAALNAMGTGSGAVGQASLEAAQGTTEQPQSAAALLGAEVGSGEDAKLTVKRRGTKQSIDLDLNEIPGDVSQEEVLNKTVNKRVAEAAEEIVDQIIENGFGETGETGPLTYNLAEMVESLESVQDLEPEDLVDIMMDVQRQLGLVEALPQGESEVLVNFNLGSNANGEPIIQVTQSTNTIKETDRDTPIQQFSTIGNRTINKSDSSEAATQDTEMNPSLLSKTSLVRKIANMFNMLVIVGSRPNIDYHAVYMEHFGLAHLPNGSDLPSFFHEFGHHVDAIVKAYDQDGVAAQELIQFSTDNKLQGDPRREAVAEYMNLRLQGDWDTILDKLPNFHKAFDSAIDGVGYTQKLEEAFQLVSKWKNQTPEQRMVAEQSNTIDQTSAEEELAKSADRMHRASLDPNDKSFSGYMRRKWYLFKRSVVDSATAFNIWDKMMGSDAATTVDSIEKLSVDARAAMSHGQDTLENGFEFSDGKRTISLAEVFSELEDNAKDLSIFLAYRRAKLMLRRNVDRAQKENPNKDMDIYQVAEDEDGKLLDHWIDDPVDPDDMKAVFNKHKDNEAFNKTNEKLDQYFTQVLEWQVDQGLMTKEKSEQLKKEAESYLPMRRFNVKGSLLRDEALKGSGRAIKNPIEVMIAAHVEMHARIGRMNVLNTMMAQVAESQQLAFEAGEQTSGVLASHMLLDLTDDITFNQEKLKNFRVKGSKEETDRVRTTKVTPRLKKALDAQVKNWASFKAQEMRDKQAKLPKKEAEFLNDEIERLDDMANNGLRTGQFVAIKIDINDEHSALRDALDDLDGMNSAAVGGIAKFARGMASVKRNALTVFNPLFWIKTPFRDLITGMVQTADPRNPFKWMKNMSGVALDALAKVTNTQTEEQKKRWAQYMASAATSALFMRENQTIYDVMGRGEFSRYADRIFAERDNIAKRGFKWLKHKGQVAATGAEHWTRMAEFNHWMDKLMPKVNSGEITMKEAERVAGFHAAEVTINFNRSGREGQKINRYVPFFNASIQGWRKFGRALKDNPIGGSAMLFSVTAIPALAQATLMAAFGDDDEVKKAFAEVTESERQFFWYFPMPLGMRDITGGAPLMRVPKPPGVIAGIARSFEIAFADQMANIDSDQAWEETIENSLLFSIPLLPAVLDIPIEYGANFNFFRRQNIIPQSMQDVSPEFQWRDSTPHVFRQLGKATGISPLMWQNFVYNYTGGLGQIAVQSTETVRKIANDEYIDYSPSNWPVARVILAQDKQFFVRSVDEYYRMRSQVENVKDTKAKITRDIKAGAATKRDLIEYMNDPDNQFWLGVAPLYSSMDKTFGTARQGVRHFNSKNSIEARKSADNIVDQMTDGLMEVNGRVRKELEKFRKKQSRDPNGLE